ncbi:MAG: LuxR C-terminal-related transcriptional regulator [Cyanobacteria bacterium P01_A01_bin.123]
MKGHSLLDSTRLLYDLQQVSDIAQAISGNLDPDAIACQVTDALVEQFDCVFARIWLVQPDQSSLRLVASSGLYTHINGAFAQVPMGAYKVGKIAQNRVPFLSNHLPEESWVKDRQWAIDNNIQGFAGYPLVVGDRTLGVLATFSHHAFAPEFLEVLQVLCMTLTVALDTALKVQQLAQVAPAGTTTSLSDRIAIILKSTHLTLVGTERHLNASLTYGFLRAAELLNDLVCNYCRLTYTPTTVSLDAFAPISSSDGNSSTDFWGRTQDLETSPLEMAQFSDLKFLATYLGGSLQIQPVMAGQAYQFLMELPDSVNRSGPKVRIQCRYDTLTHALTHLAYRAALIVSHPGDATAILLTDSKAALTATSTAIWVRSDATAIPEQATAIVDFKTTSDQLRDAVVQMAQGKQMASSTVDEQRLSKREQQVMQLLAEGLRDRNIAQQLFISESTVKFHINNSLTKLNAKNRYQGVYQAAIRGWI